MVAEVGGSSPLGHPLAPRLRPGGLLFPLGRAPTGIRYARSAPLAQWQSNGLLIRRFRVRIPGGAPLLTWASSVLPLRTAAFRSHTRSNRSASSSRVGDTRQGAAARRYGGFARPWSGSHHLSHPPPRVVRAERCESSKITKTRASSLHRPGGSAGHRTARVPGGSTVGTVLQPPTVARSCWASRRRTASARWSVSTSLVAIRRSSDRGAPGRVSPSARLRTPGPCHHCSGPGIPWL